jgi:formylglycine-generating enzyme
MLWDNELIDHATGDWQVDCLLDRAERDFGGYDLVVLWSNYPNSGVDGRHQLAYYDELPGGRAALKDAVARFHARGVRVLLDHKPWVKAAVPGFPTIEDAFIDIVRECDFDGLFLDCSAGPEESFRARMTERAGPDKIFISEAPAVPVAEGFSHIGCWQQMTDDSAAPGVYRNRLLDRTQIICESRRYFHDPIKEIQRAWMNGGGLVIWENVFGYWADYSPRCRSWMRLLFPAQRRFADHFIHGQWEPLVPGTRKINGCFVSRWTHAGSTLWTAVNRRGHTIQKGLFSLPAPAAPARYVDVISGCDYDVIEIKDGHVTLGGWFERDGLAGILEIPASAPADSDLESFLRGQRSRFSTADWTAIPWHGEHRLTPLPHNPIPSSITSEVRDKSISVGMIRIPDWDGMMETRYRMRECGYIAGEPDSLHVYDAFEKTCVRRRHAWCGMWPSTPFQ